MIEITIDKRKIKIAVMVILAIVLLIIAVRLAAPLLSGYKGPIMQSVNALNEHDSEAYPYKKYSMLDSQYDMLKLLDEINEENTKAYLDYIEGLELKFGSKYKLTYDISDKVELDDAELADIKKGLTISEDELEAYEANMKAYCEENELDDKTSKKVQKLCDKIVEDYKKLEVTKAYRVKLDCHISGSLTYADFSINEVIVAKINGQWLFVGCYDLGGEKTYYLTNPFTPEMMYSRVKDVY